MFNVDIQLTEPLKITTETKKPDKTDVKKATSEILKNSEIFGALKKLSTE